MRLPQLREVIEIDRGCTTINQAFIGYLTIKQAMRVGTCRR